MRADRAADVTVRSSPRKRGPSLSWIPAFAGTSGVSTHRHSVIHAHHAVADERRNLALAEAELGEHLLGLRTEPLRGQANTRRLAVVAHGMVDQRDRRAVVACTFNHHQRLHVLYLRVLEEIGIALHARVPDLRSLHTRAPVFGALGLQPRGDDLADLVLPAPGVLVGEGGQPRLLDRLRELLHWAKRYGDVAVARRINAVRGRIVPARDVRTRAHARRPVRGVEPSGERYRLQVKRGLHEARVDPA